ncbi:MAG: hypothetical protein ACTSUV_03620 [Candidatus Ranarchaeia archaeon]
MGLLNLFSLPTEYLSLSIFNIDTLFGIPGISLIIGIMSLIIFIITFILVWRLPTRTGGYVFAQTISYNYIYLFLVFVIMILLPPNNILGIGISLILTIIGVSAALQALVARVSQTTKNNHIEGASISFLLLVAFSYIYEFVLILFNLQPQNLVYFSNLFSYLIGIIITIGMILAYAISSKWKDRLSFQPGREEAFKNITKIIKLENVQSLIAGAGVNIVNQFRSSFANIIKSIIPTPQEEEKKDEEEEV